MNCDQTVNVKKIASGSLFIATPFSLIFFLLKEKPEKFYGLIIIGLNLIIAASDIQKIIESEILYYIEFIIGFLIITWSEILIINHILSGEK